MDFKERWHVSSKGCYVGFEGDSFIWVESMTPIHHIKTLVGLISHDHHLNLLRVYGLHASFLAMQVTWYALTLLYTLEFYIFLFCSALILTPHTISIIYAFVHLITSKETYMVTIPPWHS
jgi:hypothetical protein